MPADLSHFIVPDWPAPKSVRALVSTRVGGVSEGAYSSFNLGLHVGDAAQAVIENRERLQQMLGTIYPPQWLEQVHGVEAVRAIAKGGVLEGDAVFTEQIGLPCAVLTADCLPVFFCNQSGSQVAVAHAGWRGLASGVLEATLAKFKVVLTEIIVWLGPAIGPEYFEVGSEVRELFIRHLPQTAQAFIPNKERSGHWFADLYQLARLRLEALGVRQISGGDYCTYRDAKRFYSYRRDKITGRMASLVWRVDS